MAEFGPLNPVALDEAAFAIARGNPPAGVRKQLGISPSTLKRWQSKPEFRRRVAELRAEMLGLAMGKAVEAASAAADRLRKLVNSKQQAIALGASKALLQIGGQLFSTLQLQNQVAELSQKIAEIEAASNKATDK
jgi:hypothetical protein